MTRWRDLRTFRDTAVPKLHNLRLGDRAGLRVPPTVWLPAAEAAGADRPDLGPGAVIVRSGSPTEDTDTTSNAGQLHSEVVPPGGDFAGALERVLAPLEGSGAVFVQPVVAAAEAGVAVFDGFYYERTTATGTNAALTGGTQRGDVARGHLMRDDAWSRWIAAVGRVFLHASPSGAIDVELALGADGEFVLLQCRPALFALRRERILSLANHREILGDPPSPWIVSAVVAAGREAPAFFAEVFPEMRGWDEPYAVEVGGRAWLNFSLFFRLMDRCGLPRAMVNEGVGGTNGGPADERVLPGPFLRSIPRLVHLQLHSLREVLRARRVLDAFGRRVAAASTLPELHDALTAGMLLALRTNYGIGGMLSGAQKVRRFLRIGGRARVVTEEMMAGYQQLGGIDDPAERARALDAWLERFGHRGPLESDPLRPRFAEMRDVLLADLRQVGRAEAAPDPAPPPRLLRPFYWVDEQREWFRDELMRHWQVLRRRLLEEARRLVAAGRLDTEEDVFFLHRDDLGGETDLRAAAAHRRALHERHRDADLPLTAARADVDAALERAAPESRDDAREFPGIALGERSVDGVAVRADDLTRLLTRVAAGDVVLGPDTILVVRALEPSWAVVFPRVGGVVAEIGGELSHAAILLREARRPAIVNCHGIGTTVRDGERLRLDAARERVVRLEAVPAHPVG
jgi:phosphohistidine swiveling domain-containing protein